MGSPESRLQVTPEQPQPLMIDVEMQRAMLDMLLEDLPRHVLRMMNHRYSPEEIETVGKARKLGLWQGFLPGTAICTA